MKKIFFIVLFFTFLPFYPSTFLPALYAGWPINRTPRIEGKVTDVTTGQPIENAVISCEWVQYTASFGGDVGKTTAVSVSVTDKDGKYIVPAKSTWYTLPYWIPFFGSHFTSLGIAFLHPLYASRGYCVGKAGKKSDDEYMKKVAGKYVIWAGPKEKIVVEQKGVIHYDVGLVTLEERYIKAIESLKFKAESEEGFKKHYSEILSFTLSYSSAGYFLFLKQRGIDFDIDKVFRGWDSIVMRYSSLLPKDYFEILEKEVKWAEDKIKQKLGEK